VLALRLPEPGPSREKGGDLGRGRSSPLTQGFERYRLISSATEISVRVRTSREREEHRVDREQTEYRKPKFCFLRYNPPRPISFEALELLH